MRPTPHQLAFLRRHTVGVPLKKVLERATWPLVDRCREAGWITIQDNGRPLNFPWWWESTTLTDAGVAACRQ